MKRLLLLGASGSIGKQTIDIINEHKDELELVGASVGKNTDFLKSLLESFNLKFVYSIEKFDILQYRYPDTKFYYGEDGLNEIVKEQGYDMLVNALVGFVGFVPTLNAINNKKDIALANKETLIAGGDLIYKALSENNVNLYPIDSEHSAIAQSLRGNEKKDVRRLILTASGGSFRNKNREDLTNVTIEDALHHPNWSMGAKITIDSATMMNKGFEIMEAHHVFNVPYDKIDVLLHDESIVHSMVEYNDGSVINQIGAHDMHLPIKFALLYPRHVEDKVSKFINLGEIGTLHFKELDYDRYPLVKLAKDVGRLGGNFGAILIGANDEAVDLFLHGRIKFLEIESLIFKTLREAKFIKKPTIDDLVNSNKWAKKKVDEIWANS